MMTDWLFSVGLAPLLIAQGQYARLRTPRLPEPPGRRQGVIGEGKSLHLLLLGDSGAAGVGADHQNEALLGQVVFRLATTHQISWRLHAKTGATTASTIKRLGHLEESDFDLGLISLGVNDLTSGVPIEDWVKRYAKLRTALTDEYGVSHLIVSGLPPVDMFPALPQPLRWYLGRKAGEFSQALQQDVQQEPNCTYLDLGFTREAKTMASDGYHPSPEVYAMWGAKVADLIHSGDVNLGQDESGENRPH